MSNEIQKSGDPLKYYCIVFGLLIAVVGFVYFKLKGQLDDFKQANVRAEQYITGKGLAERGNDGKPNKLGDLALDIDNMVKGYATAIGGQGDSSNSGISLEILRRAAESARVTPFRLGREERNENKSQGYVDVSLENVYAPTTLENLIRLVFNVEELGRYRITDMRWQSLDGDKNSTPPFTSVQKPTIKVAFRSPLTKSADD